MKKQWYYVENGDKKGPYFADELKGKIEKETLLCCEGMKDCEKAELIPEFKSFFMPIPSMPRNEKVSTKTYSRISNSVIESWIFAGFSILICVLELTGYKDSNYYTPAIFLSGTTLIRVFLGLKRYFSKVLHKNGLSRIMGWLIVSLIPIYFFLLIDSRKNAEDNLLEEIGTVFIAMLILALIIHVYLFIRLRIKLSKQIEVGIAELKVFAALQLFLFPISLVLGMAYGEVDFLIIIKTIMLLVPFYFLIKGLQKIENGLVR